MRLQGKNAVVTGGGTGIGLGIAQALAGEGCRVLIAGRREEVVREAAQSFDCDPPLLAHALDVSDRDSTAALFTYAAAQLGQIDILVNSAGVNIRERSMALTTPENWDKLIAINVTGAFNCMQAVLPAMRERRDGLIVNISSIAGKRASTLGGVAYAASKFAMTALGTAVALEDGHLGIRVSNVYPGEVNTPILDGRPVKVSDEHRAQILQPEDCAAAVLMIALLPPRAHVAELVIKPTTQDYA
ncbi:MAG: SDR family oxidoreductase [Planctomycetes bacterium]|nr:SDR family oxidoreductase [Planctomycetota bacterium]